VLLGFFVIFMYYIFSKSKDEETNVVHAMSLSMAVVLFIAGLAGLVLGGKLTVDNLLFLAKSRWRSEKLIWLTILAVGTSLPELVTSVTAVLKSKTNIAIGNIIGSNIFNVFFVLGITSIVSPVQFNVANNIDIVMNIAIHVMLFIFLFIWHKGYLQRRQGVIMILAYVSYIGYMV
jgi:cation:H+ antiporter